jgi:diguanylate cyclase (GGDEF)-like protein
MTRGGARRTAGRESIALLFSTSLLGLGLLLALQSSPFPVHAPLSIPWWALIPLYALAQRYPVDFEVRKEAHSVSLTQLPLTLGLVLVNPLLHLCARLLATVINTVLRRQPLAKAAFNLGIGALDVGVAVAAVGLVGHVHAFGPQLWLALFAALILSEVLSCLALGVVWRILEIPVSASQLLTPLAFASLASALFTAFSIVAVSALYTEPMSLLIVAFLGGGLGLAYRGHRRLFAQQRTTEQLYEFVKELGPLEIDSAEARQVLSEVRLLLHASHLDLAIPTSEGWRHITVVDDDRPPLVLPDADELAEAVAHSRRPALRSEFPGEPSQMATPLVGARSLVGILTVRDRLGEVRDFDLGDLRLLETVATELTTAFERGRMLNDLERAATTDSLTSLPNLSETSRLVDEQLAAGSVLLAAVSVESFREVNDTLGHQIGDALLLEVARRLLVSQPGAVVGRIGGGRFAVSVPADSVGDDPEMFGLGIRAQVEGSAQVGPIGTHIRLSVGVVTAPAHGNDASTLLRRAETAMHSASEVHGGPVCWELAYEVKGQRRLAVLTALREALVSGAIGVAYQPKVNAVTGATTGVEALARWTHPALGAIGPDEFIPLAEASGLMGPLTSSILRQALIACKGWQRRARNVGVAVNVSASTVLNPAFVTEVAAILTSINVPAQLLTLELTEGVVVADPTLAAERLRELRALGVAISVDDFGTGYSSLTYLKGLPVDEVKIDKGFVDGIAEDPADRAVVRAVVDIAHTLGLRVVAEGVEYEEQHDLLRSLGVDEVQGYLHARPMPALETGQWLRQREPAGH